MKKMCLLLAPEQVRARAMRWAAGEGVGEGAGEREREGERGVGRGVSVGMG